MAGRCSDDLLDGHATNLLDCHATDRRKMDRPSPFSRLAHGRSDIWELDARLFRRLRILLLAGAQTPAVPPKLFGFSQVIYYHPILFHLFSLGALRA
jgi:hypothetical protein